MKYHELPENAQKLVDLMSEISEKGYDARWMPQLEYVLWKALTQQKEIQYGHYQLNSQDVQQLKALSSICNCWVRYDEEEELVPISVEEWKSIYDQNV